jgi:hypothetical protein
MRYQRHLHGRDTAREVAVALANIRDDREQTAFKNLLGGGWCDCLDGFDEQDNLYAWDVGLIERPIYTVTFGLFLDGIQLETPPCTIFNPIYDDDLFVDWCYQAAYGYPDDDDDFWDELL